MAFPPLRRVAARFGLVLAGLAVGALAAEGVARFARVDRGRELLFPNVDGYPAGLYVQADGVTYPNPAFNGEVRSVGYSVRPTFSPWGTRGATKPGATSWIAVGDSFTVALQVEDDETFAARLAERIGVDVVNAGADGYSTWKATMRYAQVSATFPSEGVILGFFLGNDFFDNRRPLDPLGPENPGRSPLPGAQPLDPAPLLSTMRPTPFQRWLHDNSAAHAWYTVWKKQRDIAAGRDRQSAHFKDELSLFTERAPDLVRNELVNTRAALSQLRDAAAKRGDRAVVLVLPPSFALTEASMRGTLTAFDVPFRAVDLTTAHDAVMREAAALGLEACSPREALVAADVAGERPYLLFDAHLSARGHEIVADVLAECIRKGAARAGAAPSTAGASPAR